MEQKIGRGSVNLRESITSGLTNAASGAIYGNNPLKSVGDALRRGVGAGAATAAINHLSNGWDTQTLQGGSRGAGASNMQAGMITPSSYGRKRDPRSGCGAPSPFNGKMSYGASYGYQYKETSGGTDRSKKAKSGGFSIVDFAKDVMVGGLMGGLSSVTFYGAGKAVSAVRNSIKGDSRADDIIQYERLKSQYAANEIINAERIGSGLHPDPMHRAASFLAKEQLASGRTYSMTGRDNRPYTLLQTKGQLNNVNGIFEYISNSQGQVTHQRFIQGGTYTGFSNQIVSKGGY